MRILIIKNDIVENIIEADDTSLGVEATGNLENANIGDVIKNGKILKPIEKIDYKQQRQSAYKSIPEQLDMIYWDKVNNTDKWQTHIKSVKDKFPKS